MDELFKNWREYLKNNQTIKVYCDMDGVLVDFVNPVLKLMNTTLEKIESENNKKIQKLGLKAKEALKRDYFVIDDIKISHKNTNKEARNFMYYLLKDNTEFWAKLPWAPGGKELWNNIKNLNTEILTSPLENDSSSKKGKILWVKEHLGLEPAKVHFSDKKYEYAVSKENQINILIDDFSKNVLPFKSAGGLAILHKTGNTIATLKKLNKIISG